jgi:hypothetical protein
MTNGLMPTGGNAVSTIGGNVWEEYADAAGGNRYILGDLLKYSKIEWLAGQNNDAVKSGTKVVVIMNSLLAGWVKWEYSRPTEHHMVEVVNGEKPLKRDELGDNDETQWETDNTGKPRDPYQLTNYLVMVDVNTKKVYTFVTASFGGRGEVANLCKVYGKNIREAPDKFPVVSLDVGSFKSKDRSIGKVGKPVFTITGWVEAEDWISIVKGASAAGQEERDSDIPFDGAGPAPADGLDIPAGLDRRTKSKSKTQF